MGSSGINARCTGTIGMCNLDDAPLVIHYIVCYGVALFLAVVSIIIACTKGSCQGNGVFSMTFAVLLIICLAVLTILDAKAIYAIVEEIDSWAEDVNISGEKHRDIKCMFLGKLFVVWIGELYVFTTACADVVEPVSKRIMSV